MKRALVDVNVVLDVLLARAPHATSATACLAAIESGRFEGLLSAHAVTTVAYLVGRALGKPGARRAIGDLCTIFGIAPVDEGVIRRAIALALADFEDAVTAAAAEASGCEAIITRDATGFAGSPVPALEPALWLALLGESSSDHASDAELREPSGEYGAKRRRRSPARGAGRARKRAKR